MVLAVSTALTLLYSIIVFLIIILLLVVMLLYARDKLTPKGDVRLLINDRELVVSPGSTLLSTLSSNGDISAFRLRRQRYMRSVQMPGA